MLPLQSVPVPPRLVIPMLQHAGAEAQPLVTSGQKVLKGEAIGRYEMPTTGYVHASTSGTVVAIARQLISHPSGMEGLCVVLKPDGLDRWMPLQPTPGWQSCHPAELRDRISKSGIVGLGGAVFPTDKKIEEARKTAVHTLILNGAECEPYISCDEMLMREQPDRVIKGALVLQKALEVERTLIAIEDRMGEACRALQTAMERSGSDSIRLVRVASIYPEGGEKQLIQVLTGLEVPLAGRPMDLGLICQNVATAAAVADAVIDGKPLVERILTVTGNGVQQPRNLIALLGTPVASLVDVCGGYSMDATRLVVGGPMMGYALATDQNPVVKAANCILVLSSEDMRPAQEEMPCIRCGECARVCPALLLPQTLLWQVRNQLLDDAEEFGLGACIECGCCDLVCPSHIPLVEWYRFGKSELRILKGERSRAELARERFEAHEARLEQLRNERNRRMQEKKTALREDAQKKHDITAIPGRAQSRSNGPADTPDHTTDQIDPDGS